MSSDTSMTDYYNLSSKTDKEIIELCMKTLFNPFAPLSLMQKVKDIMVQRQLKIQDVFLTMNYIDSKKQEDSTAFKINVNVGD